jgi:hypothetical protein
MSTSCLQIQFKLHPTPAVQKSIASSVPQYGSLPRVTQVVALALHFQEMVRQGEAKDYADLARLGVVSRQRMSQIMMLIWLAPDIQQELLYLPPVPGGRYPITELSVRPIGNILSWRDQRAEWKKLKVTLHLV